MACNWLRLRLATGAAWLLLSSFGGAVCATEFTVDSNADAVDALPGDGLCASAADGCTLRAAIQEANAFADGDADGDRIVLPAGSYLLTLAGQNEDLAASGDLDISSRLAIAGSDPASTVIDGNGLDRVIEVISPAVASITGVTLRGGGQVTLGGGVNNASVLVMQACVVEDNGGAAGDVRLGAGIANSGVLTVTGCLLRNNTAGSNVLQGAGGGGLYNLLTAAINGRRISGNSALGNGNSGGGVLSQAPGITQISTSGIESNSAGNGGGITVLGGTLFLNASAVVNNVANGSIGAGPNANGLGGGLRVNGGSANLVNSSFSGNDANRDGGGIQLAAGAVDLRNVTLSDNSADLDGNGSGDGGGLRVADGLQASARNSLLSGNHDSGSSVHPDCSGALRSDGYLWLQDSTGCTLTAATGDVSGSDPQLQPLADNGGVGLSHALPVGSPAIDAGNPEGCIGNSVSGTDVDGNAVLVDVPLLVDQRQRVRPQDGDFDSVAVCDVGAYEYVPETIFHDGFEQLPTP